MMRPFPVSIARLVWEATHPVLEKIITDAAPTPFMALLGAGVSGAFLLAQACVRQPVQSTVKIKIDIYAIGCAHMQPQLHSPAREVLM